MLDDAYQAESADDEPEQPAQPEPISRAPREVRPPVFEDPLGVLPQQADGTYSRLTPQQVDERQMMGRLPEHARQHLAVQQLALSQAEKMNLQRLQNGMGTVDKMLTRGQIDQDQADEMKAKILQIKGPLERRAAQAVAQQHEQQSQLIQHQVAQAASMDAINAKFHALSAQDRATPVDLGDDRKGVMVQTSPGKWQLHELKDDKGAEEARQEKVAKHLEAREKDWRTVYDHAVKMVDNKIADKREAEAEANADAQKKGTGVREHSDFNRDKMIADELKARGHEGTIEEHRAAERVKLGLKPQAEVNPIKPPNTPDSGGPPPPPSPGEVRQRVTTIQQGQTKLEEAFKAGQIGRDDFEAGKAASDELGKLVQQHGDRALMPPAIQRRYDQIVARLLAIRPRVTTHGDDARTLGQIQNDADQSDREAEFRR